MSFLSSVVLKVVLRLSSFECELYILDLCLILLIPIGLSSERVANLIKVLKPGMCGM